MSNPVWPGSLPQYVLQQGYGEDLQEQVLRAPMEGGGQKQRRRFSGRFDVISVSIICSSAQVALFETFYFTTLGGGSLVFDWVHPRKQTAASMKIVSKASVAPSDGDNFRVTFKVEVQP